MFRKLHRHIIVLIPLLVIALSAMSDISPQEKYIRKYAPVAVSEMYRTGVPASITLAQGLLESGSGLSRLATQGNNHFGIKCHNWNGRKIYHDDDARNECFRAYDSAEESFRDHSDFLRYWDRYKFLFENETTDYKAWAYGLKKAGYATDPAYPAKLIKYIETYNLDRFDTVKFEDIEDEASAEEIAQITGDQYDEPEEELSKREKRRLRKQKQHEQKTGKTSSDKVDKSDKSDKSASQVVTIPQSPLQIESPKRFVPRPSESYNFSLNRQVMSRNGVPCVSAEEGESLRSIAQEYNLFLKEILKFNDLTSVVEIRPGTIVYIQQKKNQAAKGMDAYIVDHDGESLRDISQRFGVKLDAVCTMNGITRGQQLREGDKIVLRKRAAVNTSKRK